MTKVNFRNFLGQSTEYQCDEFTLEEIAQLYILSVKGAHIYIKVKKEGSIELRNIDSLDTERIKI